jgi:hypothetical protein
MFGRVREAKRRWQNRARLLPAALGLGLAVWGLVPLIGALTGSGTHWFGLAAGIFLIIVGLGIGLPSLLAYRSATRSHS